MLALIVKQLAKVTATCCLSFNMCTKTKTRVIFCTLRQDITYHILREFSDFICWCHLGPWEILMSVLQHVLPRSSPADAAAEL